MAAALLTLDGISLTFGGDKLLDGVSISVQPQSRIALVGRNGSGKSTLLKIAAGIVEPDGGSRYVDPVATVAYLPQEPDFSGYGHVLEYVEAGLSDVADRHDAVRAIEDFQLEPDQVLSALSGGEARRAALARIFAARPDVILLDEPTNHLDIVGIEALESRVRSYHGASVVISHDRRFLEAVSTETVWMDRGAIRHLSRGFEAFEAWRDKLLDEEEAEAHRLDRKIAMEEDWVRYGVTARRKRNVRRMGELADLRRKKKETRKPVGVVNFTVAKSDASGKRVIVAEKISKSFGDRPVVSEFSIEIARGDRIGFVGPNGAGKTTLLRMLTGDLAPDSGEATLGARLDVMSLDQKRSQLSENMRVADAITDGRGDWVTIGAETRHVATYLKDFLFVREQWRAPVSSLSGGERGRLALAAALAKPSNLLVLDEPTNDLDLETLDLLEEAVADYAGTVLVVSHDRKFLDRIATSVIAPDPAGKPGRWLEFVGGYSDYLAERDRAFPTTTGKLKVAKQERISPQSAEPQRQKLSYKEKFALEQLPSRIASLTDKVAAFKAALADPSLFARDAAAFNEKAATLEMLERDLAAAETEWLELEMKREALEN